MYKRPTNPQEYAAAKQRREWDQRFQSSTHMKNREMTPEQVAAYAQDLAFGSKSGSLRESLGITMGEACYEVRSYARVSHVIGRLNQRKNESLECEMMIEQIIACIRGEEEVESC